MASMSTSTDREPPLSLSEEAARFLAAMNAKRNRLRDVPQPSTDREHPATCTWCPVCRGVESMRSVDPEAVDRLALAIGELAKALGELGATLRDRVVTPGYQSPTRSHPETRDGARSNHGGARPGRGSHGGGGTAHTVDIPVTDEDER